MEEVEEQGWGVDEDIFVDEGVLEVSNIHPQR